MNLYTSCNACKKEIEFKSKAKDRDQLQKQVGEDVSIQCEGCGTENHKHPNDIIARINQNRILYFFSISMIASFILFHSVGLVATFLIVLPFLLWQVQSIAVNVFNNVVLKSKRKTDDIDDEMLKELIL